MTPHDFAVLVFILASIGVVLCLVIPPIAAFAGWAPGRGSERTAAATFERDYIPEAVDVADQDVPAMLEEMVALLDDSIAHVKRLDRAAK